MNERTAHILARLIVIGLVAQLGVIGYVFYAGYWGRVETVKNQRIACERNELDRADNAAFQRAHATYIHHQGHRSGIGPRGCQASGSNGRGDFYPYVPIVVSASADQLH